MRELCRRPEAKALAAQDAEATESPEEDEHAEEDKPAEEDEHASHATNATNATNDTNAYMLISCHTNSLCFSTTSMRLLRCTPCTMDHGQWLLPKGLI